MQRLSSHRFFKLSLMAYPAASISATHRRLHIYIYRSIFPRFLVASPDYRPCFVTKGTTWMQEIVWLICHNADIEAAKQLSLSTRSPYLESVDVGEHLGFQALENWPTDSIRSVCCIRFQVQIQSGNSRKLRIIVPRNSKILNTNPTNPVFPGWNRLSPLHTRIRLAPSECRRIQAKWRNRICDILQHIRRVFFSKRAFVVITQFNYLHRTAITSYSFLRIVIEINR